MKFIYKIYTYLKYYPSSKIKWHFRFKGDEIFMPQKSKYKKILFCPFSPHRTNIFRESILAHACKIRGADVKMISCDLFLPAIDYVSAGAKKDLKVAYKLVDRIYRLIKLPALHLSQYTKSLEIRDCSSFTPDDIIDLKHNDIVLGDLVIASTVRYFFCNGPEWDTPEFIDKARQYAASAIFLTDVFDRLFDSQTPDKVVSSHGIYVSWGVMFRVARNKGIPVDVYGNSYRHDTLRFYHNIPNAPFPDGEWKSYKNVELKPKEIKEVDWYISTRITQSEDSATLFSENSSFPDELKTFIENTKNSSKKLFCLFTNISWDAYMFRQGNQPFESMIIWMQENIKYFSDNSKSSLIIKAHPAENYHNVPEKYRVKNFIHSLPSNIYFISESDNVKPYSFYNDIDCGLIYTSTVCLEMALKNIPVITAGVGGHYSNKGFTYDPLTKEEYFNAIREIEADKFTFTPNIDFAKRYLYFRFYREAIKNNYLSIEKNNVKQYKFSSLDEFIPGTSKELDIICNGILNDTPFIN